MEPDRPNACRAALAPYSTTPYDGVMVDACSPVSVDVQVRMVDTPDAYWGVVIAQQPPEELGSFDGAAPTFQLSVCYGDPNNDFDRPDDELRHHASLQQVRGFFAAMEEARERLKAAGFDV